MSEVVRFAEAQNKVVESGAWGRRNMELFIEGYKVTSV
jgi:hypothetical protein